MREGARPAIDHAVLVGAPPYCLLPAEHPLAARRVLSRADLAPAPLTLAVGYESARRLVRAFVERPLRRFARAGAAHVVPPPERGDGAVR